MKEIKEILKNEALEGLTKKEMLKVLKEMQKEVEKKIERKFKFNVLLETENGEILVSSSMIDFKDNNINIKLQDGIIYENDEGGLSQKKEGFDDTRICDIEDIEKITYIVNTGQYRVQDSQSEHYL